MAGKYRSTTDLALVLLGLLAWIVAALLAITVPTTPVTLPASAGGGTVRAEAPNLAAAGAACGFAIGGAICFLGAAFAARDARRGPNPGDTP
jgi:hypothetical protein